MVRPAWSTTPEFASTLAGLLQVRHTGPNVPRGDHAIALFPTRLHPVGTALGLSGSYHQPASSAVRAWARLDALSNAGQWFPPRPNMRNVVLLRALEHAKQSRSFPCVYPCMFISLAWQVPYDVTGYVNSGLYHCWLLPLLEMTETMKNGCWSVQNTKLGFGAGVYDFGA